MPLLTASCPMYRWQKPPILPIAYASAHRSSKRRCSSIECSSSRLSAGSFGASPLPESGPGGRGWSCSSSDGASSLMSASAIVFGSSGAGMRGSVAVAAEPLVSGFFLAM